MGQSLKNKKADSHEEAKMEFHQGKSLFGEYELNESNVLCIYPPKESTPPSILLCMRAPVGDINVCFRKIGIGRGLCSISPKKIDFDFLYYFLIFSKSNLVSKSTGSTFQAITIKVVKNLIISLPTELEQKNISKKISTCFSMIRKLTNT